MVSFTPSHGWMLPWWLALPYPTWYSSLELYPRPNVFKIRLNTFCPGFWEYILAWFHSPSHAQAISSHTDAVYFSQAVLRPDLVLSLENNKGIGKWSQGGHASSCRHPPHQRPWLGLQAMKNSCSCQSHVNRISFPGSSTLWLQTQAPVSQSLLIKAWTLIKNCQIPCPHSLVCGPSLPFAKPAMLRLSDHLSVLTFLSDHSPEKFSAFKGLHE